MKTFDVIISEITAEKIIKKELHKEDYFDLMVFLEYRNVWVCISSLKSFMHRISEISKVEIWSSIGTKEHVTYLSQKYGKA
jgi:hypothetical protein